MKMILELELIVGGNNEGLEMVESHQEGHGINYMMKKIHMLEEMAMDLIEDIFPASAMDIIEDIFPSSEE